MIWSNLPYLIVLPATCQVYLVIPKSHAPIYLRSALFHCCRQCPSLTSLSQEELLLESLDLPGGAYPRNGLILCALPEAGAPYIYGSTYHTALVTLALSVLFPMSLNF